MSKISFQAAMLRFRQKELELAILIDTLGRTTDVRAAHATRTRIQLRCREFARVLRDAEAARRAETLRGNTRNKAVPNAPLSSAVLVLAKAICADSTARAGVGRSGE